MTRTELARRLGLTHVAVYHWEHGRNAIPLHRFLRLCSVLGVPPSYFLDHDDLCMCVECLG